MSLGRNLRANIEDVFRYGPQFLKRHTPKITGRDTALIRVGRQQIHVRANGSDTPAVRQAFGGQYDIASTILAVEKRIDERYEQILGDGKIPLIVDAGANIGAASLWFKQKYPAATVVAIEPDPRNFSVLEKNSKLADGVLPLWAAIGSEDGFVSVHYGNLAVSTRVRPASEGVRMITMKHAIDLIENGVPFIAKVDIEGFEEDLFARNTDWLADVFVLHIEPHDWMLPGKGTSLSFQKAVAQHEFEMFLAGDTLTFVKRWS